MHRPSAKSILPFIIPELLSQRAKVEGLEIMKKLHEDGMNFELSIRSFENCAKLVEIKVPGYEAMIKEQLRLQSLKGGTRY